VKKFSLLLLILTVCGISLPQTATAAVRTIELIEQPHQLIDGRFISDDLATSLTPEGRSVLSFSLRSRFKLAGLLMAHF
jgi:hypothetical protein